MTLVIARSPDRIGPGYIFAPVLGVIDQSGVRAIHDERPQQSAALALSEYAPGRLIVIDKKTYRSGGVAASALPSTLDRAAPLFQAVRRYTFCPHCTYVHYIAINSIDLRKVIHH